MGRKVGQAPALSTRDWRRWITYVRRHGTTQMSVLLEFTGLFALRCGEACCLTVADLRLQDQPPHLVVRPQPGASKSPEKVPITPIQARFLRKLQHVGVSVTRSRSNRWKTWTYKDTYKLPSAGPLFPSVKSGKCISYHAAWAAVSTLSKRFHKDYPDNDFNRIRTHSGRCTCITRLMGEGVPLSMSMKFARHKPGSMRVHLGYGQLSCQDVYNSLTRAPHQSNRQSLS